MGVGQSEGPALLTPLCGLQFFVVALKEVQTEESSPRLISLSSTSFQLIKPAKANYTHKIYLTKTIRADVTLQSKILYIAFNKSGKVEKNHG